MKSDNLIMISQDDLAELAASLAPQVREKEWLTEKEVATYLDVKVQTVRNYCADGLLEYSEVTREGSNRAGVRMIKHSSMLKMLENRKNKAYKL